MNALLQLFQQYDTNEEGATLRHELDVLKAYQFAVDQHAIVAITDTAGTIIHVNDKFCEISGYSRNELLGKNHRIINSGYQNKSYWKTMYKTIANGEVWHDEIRNLTKDGHHYWVSTTIVPLKDAHGKPKSYMSIRTDITHRKQVEYELIHSQDTISKKIREATNKLHCDLEQSESTNKVRSRLLSNMSHELRTPLHAILGYTDMSLLRVHDEKAHDFLEKIKTSGVRLTTLIDDLLELDKLEQGKMVLLLAEQNIATLVQGCISELQSLCYDKNITIKMKVGNEVTGVMDQKLVTQVIINLLSNAIKFSPMDGIISINADYCMEKTNQKEVTAIKVSIKDTGAGITHDDLETVFDRFIQSQDNVTSETGTGLGLSISKEIIDAHHGKIWAESPPANESNGAIFHFILPSTHSER